MFNRRTTAALAAALMLALPASAQAYAWHTVVTKTVSGTFSSASFDRTINAPVTAIRITSTSTVRADIIWSIDCSKNWNFDSKSGEWKPLAGTKVKGLPLGLSHPDSCDVSVMLSTAGLSGGTVKVALQKR